MNGVEILNEYAVSTTHTWVVPVALLAMLGAILFIVMTANSKRGITGCMGLVCALICFIFSFTLGLIESGTDYLKEYSHTEYKVTIDDSVSMNEFLDKYEILDQEGKIYTVKERTK